MEKWYENPIIDETPVISARIRLARNIRKYNFHMLLGDKDASDMINETARAVRQCPNPLNESCDFILLHNFPEVEKRILLEHHIISNALYTSDRYVGLLRHFNDSVSVMLNEEDHIRIQSIMPGADIDGAWEMADQLDDAIEQSTEYAFDKSFGYLTACPTNTGTGLRASLMLHLPMLERSGHLKNIIPALSKFGMTVRGLYGEGTEPMGSIYQVSNQLTLGKSEIEIIEALKTVAKQIIDNENWLMERALQSDRQALADNAYRSYGVLQYCRKLGEKEAMTLLSNVRLGFLSGLLEVAKPKQTIYNMMMNSQPGALSKRCESRLNDKDMDVYRAEYIRDAISKLNN